MKENRRKVIAALVFVGIIIALGSAFVALTGMIAFVAAVAATIVFLIKKDNLKTKKAVIAVGVAFLVSAVGLILVPTSESAPEKQTARVEESLPKTGSSATSESSTQKTSESTVSSSAESSSDSAQKREEQKAEEQRLAAEAKKAEEEKKALEQQQAAEAQKAEEERKAQEQQQAQLAAQKAEEDRLAQEAAAAQQQVAAQQAQAAAEAQQAPQPQPVSQTVFIAPQSGTKYHSHSGCRGLSNANSVEEVAMENVGNRTACSFCY
ncbi:hypothetical protein JZO70_00960 [Enterococcus sp. 669A]|uniref:Uncharacterized protein n=1 Tax=Candidatus Enterococcus moelleringii TaxID=2815325 RepID=A0ABS3L6L2_9ENTE|nr:hypothetical protein [Enterococcus sp. 669A]MBO1304713.1 hypothetical protein [Enterococcus sp. 669A]